MIRITDVKAHPNGIITLSCCHGSVDLINDKQIRSALRHTGIEYFPNYGTKYLREMLIGRLAKVDSIHCSQSSRYRVIIQQKKSFSLKFRVIVNKERKHGKQNKRN